MSDIAIRVENLSKYYNLGVINSGTLSRDLQSWLWKKMGKEDPNRKIGVHEDNAEGFWALKDLNFEIKKGERVGIIGKNGAGKSTLLKMLSQISAPTEGKIYINGKVASLLEVGTGFNPELTGRENIYMNGAILGMKKREIDAKIDEIIAFSEIERHIDTPVKRYSSGMYVRLAFAVAAHLDSDILIADEVLAVGDAAFQKKALGKMNELSSGQGRTVLFVSHNMGAVKQLCQRGIVLERGKLIIDSSINEAMDAYLVPLQSDNGIYIPDDKDNKPIYATKIWLSSNGKKTDIFDVYDKIEVNIEYTVCQNYPYSNISLSLFKDVDLVLYSWDIDTNEQLSVKKTGHYRASVELPKNLNIGVYSLGISFGEPGIGAISVYRHCLSFRIDNNSIARSNVSFTRGGILRTSIDWKIEKL